MHRYRSFTFPFATARALLLASLLAGGATALPLRADADPPARDAAPSLVVNINTASAEELQQLPGVGPSRAQAIIEQRQRRPFARVEELMRVRGIGRSTFRSLRPHLTVEGATRAPARAEPRGR